MSGDASLASLSIGFAFFARGLAAMRVCQPLDRYDSVRLPGISMGTTLRDSTRSRRRQAWCIASLKILPYGLFTWRSRTLDCALSAGKMGLGDRPWITSTCQCSSTVSSRGSDFPHPSGSAYGCVMGDGVRESGAATRWSRSCYNRQ